MIEFLNNLRINRSLERALEKQGITELTQVQKAVIPETLQNKDLVVQSETGTGKTLAFLVPLFAKIDQDKREMQAIILAPTHELVMQIIRQIEMLAKNSQIDLVTSSKNIKNVSKTIQTDNLEEHPGENPDSITQEIGNLEFVEAQSDENFKKNIHQEILNVTFRGSQDSKDSELLNDERSKELATDFTKITSTPIIGNVNIERQIEKLREKPHIIVGTPGRVLELIKKKKIAAHTIKTIIIDEADTLTGESNIVSIKEIVKSTLKERQLLMFSATITKQAEMRAIEMMKEPQFINAKSDTTVPASIEHSYFLTEERDKLEVLRKVIGIVKPVKALVFIGAREDADYCTNRLKHHGLNVDGLHGHTDKKDRKRVMDDFRAGKIPTLVVSDIAARGLDIEGITHIFNLNIPEQAKDYLHRVGRTGRIGNKGYAISIVTERELQFIEEFEKALKIEIAHKDMFKGNLTDVKKKR